MAAQHHYSDCHTYQHTLTPAICPAISFVREGRNRVKVGSVNILMEKVSNNTHLIHVVLSGPTQLVVHSKNLTLSPIKVHPLTSPNKPKFFVRK
jgi:hypothetical protein